MDIVLGGQGMDNDGLVNTTSLYDLTTEATAGLPQFISVLITISFLAVVLLGVYAIYRLFCKSKSKHEGAEANPNGRKKDFFDQFDVNGSQTDIAAEEKKFDNPAAKLTSESESTSSNNSTTSPGIRSGALNSLVQSLHGDRFAVSRVRERSSRASSLKVRVPKHFIDTKDDDQYSLALIDRRSNTIHNLDLRDCMVVDGKTAAPITPTSALFAQRWKDRTRQRRSRRSSTLELRTRQLPRQTSCPNSMFVKGCNSESLSSQSEEGSSPRPIGSAVTEVSLSSIDETANKPRDSANSVE